MIRFTGYGVIGEKPRVSHLPEIFRAPCRKNCAMDQKMISTFLMVSTTSITKQSLGEIVLCAPAVWCENMVFVCLCVFVTLRSAGPLFVWGVHSSNLYCVTVNGSVLMWFSAFFGIDSPFRCTAYFSFSFLHGATIFAKLWSKTAKSPKIGE